MDSGGGKERDHCRLQCLGKQLGEHRQEEDEDRRRNPCGRVPGAKDRMRMHPAASLRIGPDAGICLWTAETRSCPFSRAKRATKIPTARASRKNTAALEKK